MARTKVVKKAKFDPHSILEDVNSSHIRKMGFHKGIMYVLYSKSGLYFFEGFTLKQYKEIRAAESIGAALHATGVRGNKYEVGES